jgi:hypothetical protein
VCKRCDDRAVQAEIDLNREDEPCPEGQHDYGEAGEWPAGHLKDSDIYCQNCGWTLAAIKDHDDHDGAADPEDHGQT